MRNLEFTRSIIFVGPKWTYLAELSSPLNVVISWEVSARIKSSDLSKLWWDPFEVQFTHLAIFNSKDKRSARLSVIKWRMEYFRLCRHYRWLVICLCFNTNFVWICLPQYVVYFMSTSSISWRSKQQSQHLMQYSQIHGASVSHLLYLFSTVTWGRIAFLKHSKVYIVSPSKYR